MRFGVKKMTSAPQARQRSNISPRLREYASIKLSPLQQSFKPKHTVTKSGESRSTSRSNLSSPCKVLFPLMPALIILSCAFGSRCHRDTQWLPTDNPYCPDFLQSFFPIPYTFFTILISVMSAYYRKSGNITDPCKIKKLLINLPLFTQKRPSHGDGLFVCSLFSLRQTRSARTCPKTVFTSSGRGGSVPAVMQAAVP